MRSLVPTWWALAALVACGGERDEATLPPADADTDADVDTDTDPRPTADTGDWTTTIGPDWATCALADGNALRVVCSVTDPARTGPATFTVTQGDRVRTAEAIDGEEVVLWGLAPNQQLTWTVVHGDDVGSGAFPTDPLPAGVASMQVTPTAGAAVQTEAFAVPFTCDGMAGAAVIDAAGELVWYHQETATGAGVLMGNVGTDWVGDRVFMGLGGRSLLELSATGEELFRIEGTDRPVHHDVALGPTYRYALNASQHDVTVVDGFYVIDDAGAIVAEWDLADHVEVGTTGIGGYWLMEFPFAQDWSHANSIEIDGSDHVLISFKHLNAVVRVVANPARSDFGTIEWVIDGGRNTWEGTITWADDGAFLDQHHVARRADGGLSIFDNASQPQSRALLLDLDEGAGTVAVDESWSFDGRCAIQGSVYERPGGSVLSMCTTSGTVREFEPGVEAPAWEVEVLCIQRSGGSGHLARAIPVDLPD